MGSESPFSRNTGEWLKSCHSGINIPLTAKTFSNLLSPRRDMGLEYMDFWQHGVVPPYRAFSTREFLHFPSPYNPDLARFDFLPNPSFEVTFWWSYI